MAENQTEVLAGGAVLAAALALFKYKVGVIKLIAACAVVGLIVKLLL